MRYIFFFFQAEDGIRDIGVTGVQTCALPISELAAKLASGKGVYGTDAEQAFIEEHFPACPNVSIDFGIMEKADNVFVSLGDFGWSEDRKSTRLNSSHANISYAVFCLKKKNFLHSSLFP